MFFIWHARLDQACKNSIVSWYPLPSLLPEEAKSTSVIETLAQEASSKAKPEEESNTDLKVKTEMQEKKEDFREKEGKYLLAQVNKELAQAESGLDTITTEYSEGKCSY